MNAKRFALGTLIGGTAMWLVAGLWHSVIAATFYARETESSHEGTGIIFVAYLILGALMSYLFPRFERGGHPAIEGLQFGVVMGLLWVFPHELAMAGAHGGSIPYVLKNAAWHMVEQGIGGVVIAMVYAARAARGAPHPQP